MLVAEVIDSFATSAKRISKRHDSVVLVRTLETLNPLDWRDEMHLTPLGMMKIADRFVAALREAFPDCVAPSRSANGWTAVCPKE